MVGWCFNAAETNWQIWVCFKIQFAVMEGEKRFWLEIINEQQNISFERFAWDKTRQVGCTNICLVY